MSCNSCATTAQNKNIDEKDTNNEEPKGCQSNGNCGTSGCNRLNSFDWLSQMELPDTKPFEIIEVKFKGGRKAFCRNINGLHLITGDAVVLEVERGFHVGHVSLQGELVRLQMRKKRIKTNDESICNILRKASQADVDKLIEARNRELPTMYRTREIINQLNLAMKLSDVEYQADCSKATFYYSADARVDFRELIRLLAGEFRIRIEMRQISLRQEASRVGGIGVCGRELCCSTWLTDFKPVSTSAARYQNLSLNTAKLSGQCGKLKCCLNYELDTYLDALKDIPEVKYLRTQEGEAQLQKTDIFKKLMWFSYNSENVWYSLTIEEVEKVLSLNKKNEFPSSLKPSEWVSDGEISDTTQQDNHIIDAEEFERNVRRKAEKEDRVEIETKRQRRTRRPRRNITKAEEVRENTSNQLPNTENQQHQTNKNRRRRNNRLRQSKPQNKKTKNNEK
ncbi:stage 0 sporulation family protein [Bernardetia sp.]|uniref:PSP1 domain-containing protein n=1 Tax=Bernardetia sp. TaxID=1937974 RepID=UPI0025BD73ED|nr:regulatory iron-sulfur-containing complex subunit RicT [Bernardetia sp.]